MKADRLMQAQERFLAVYPGGFDDPGLMEITKKHRLNRMTVQMQEAFTLEGFRDPAVAVEAFVKLISGSSLVSVFEKAALRNMVKAADQDLKQALSEGLRIMLHEDQAKGFDLLAALLLPYKLAKWPILTVGLLYWDTEHEVLIKPTTVKKVIRFFGLEELEYTPRVHYDFYAAYRRQFIRMRHQCLPLVGPDNAAFSGFLMLAMDLLEQQERNWDENN